MRAVAPSIPMFVSPWDVFIRVLAISPLQYLWPLFVSATVRAYPHWMLEQGLFSVNRTASFTTNVKVGPHHDIWFFIPYLLAKKPWGLPHTDISTTEVTYCFQLSPCWIGILGMRMASLIANFLDLNRVWWHGSPMTYYCVLKGVSHSYNRYLSFIIGKYLGLNVYNRFYLG